MNRLKLYGVITQVLPPETRIYNGQDISTQDFILDITGDSQYQRFVCLTLRGKSLNQTNIDRLIAGKDVTVHFDLSSYQTQTKDGQTFYRHRTQVWQIEQGNTTGQTIQNKNEPFQPVFAKPTTPTTTAKTKTDTTEDDNIPF